MKPPLKVATLTNVCVKKCNESSEDRSGVCPVQFFLQSVLNYPQDIDCLISTPAAAVVNGSRAVTSLLLRPLTGSSIHSPLPPLCVAFSWPL